MAEEHDKAAKIIRAKLANFPDHGARDGAAVYKITGAELGTILDALERRVPAVEAEPVKPFGWVYMLHNGEWQLTDADPSSWTETATALYASPPPAWKPPREAVARIVDPQAFACAEEDRAKAVQWHKKADDYWETEDASAYPYGQISKDRIFKSWKEHAEGYEQSAIKRTVSAYARADAILALQPEQAG